jgi:preprotein translocase subunit SecD
LFKRAGKPVFFIVAFIIAAITYLAISGFHYYVGDIEKVSISGAQEIRFGIDIKGGVDVMFKPDAGYNATATEMSAANAIITQRLDNLKITDRDIYMDVKKQRIIVRFPWKSDEKDFDPETAVSELGAMTELKFTGPDGSTVITGRDVEKAEATYDQEEGGYYVSLKLKDSGKAAFAAATEKFLGKVITISMDDQVIEAPTVQNVINNGIASITGSFTAESANALANKINGGTLPFKLVTDNYSTIAPTLGANSLDVMVRAGALAFILVCLFMMVYYRMPGFIAAIVLCGQIAGTILAISIPHFTLTLPGIAGIILSIGMGVDCNVITNERINEELRAGKTIDGAIDAGFTRSFAAIFDGNVTVAIAGLILMQLGSGAVLSFGYTLFVGVIFNMIMGIFFSRLMLKSVSRFSFLRKLSLYGGRVK